MNIESAAYSLVYSRFNSSTRSLLKSCEPFVRYEKNFTDSLQVNEYSRQFCLIAPNYTVFNRISKKLEMLTRTINAVMPKTSILLFEESRWVSFYDTYSTWFDWNLLKIFEAEETTFYLRANPTNCIYFVTTTDGLVREKQFRANRAENLYSDSVEFTMRFFSKINSL